MTPFDGVSPARDAQDTLGLVKKESTGAVKWVELPPKRYQKYADAKSAILRLHGNRDSEPRQRALSVALSAINFLAQDPEPSGYELTRVNAMWRVLFGGKAASTPDAELGMKLRQLAEHLKGIWQKDYGEVWSRAERPADLVERSLHIFLRDELKIDVDSHTKQLRALAEELVRAPFSIAGAMTEISMITGAFRAPKESSYSVQQRFDKLVRRHERLSADSTFIVERRRRRRRA